MAAFSHVVLVLLMYSIQNCWAQDNNKSILTFQPPKIKLTPNTTSSGTRINISCQPPSGVIDVLGLVISKRNKSNPSQLVDLVKALSIKNNGDATLATSLPGASASGTVNERKITLEMSKASCSDEGSYVCAVSYYSTTLKEARDEDELKVEVSPGEITMTSSPPNPSRVWNENSTLTLTCSGPVGSVNTTGSTDDPQIRWRWEYRKSGVSWSPYDGEEQDINTQSLISRSCYKTQTSTLTRRLTVADSQREYRCYVMRNSQGFTQFAQSYQVGSVTVSGGGNLPESDNTSKANTGAIVGGVFGALICVAVVIIIIYFVVIRPRRRKAQEKRPAQYIFSVPGTASSVTGDGDESTDEKGTAPSHLGAGEPEVVYSQPVRRGKDKPEGVTNKALDVSSEKQTTPNNNNNNDGTTPTTPPDNDDKRHGRRHRDKKQQQEAPGGEDYDPHYAKLNRQDPPRGHYPDPRPARGRGRDSEPPRPSEDNHRRNRRRPRDAGEDDEGYDNSRHRGRYDDEDDQGRRNRGYQPDDRRGRGRHPQHAHSSSEDGGMDSFVNTSQYSMGDGDPTMGTAI